MGWFMSTINRIVAFWRRVARYPGPAAVPTFSYRPWNTVPRIAPFVIRHHKAAKAQNERGLWLVAERERRGVEKGRRRLARRPRNTASRKLSSRGVAADVQVADLPVIKALPADRNSDLWTTRRRTATGPLTGADWAPRNTRRSIRSPRTTSATSPSAGSGRLLTITATRDFSTGGRHLTASRRRRSWWLAGCSYARRSRLSRPSIRSRARPFGPTIRVPAMVPRPPVFGFSTRGLGLPPER